MTHNDYQHDQGKAPSRQQNIEAVRNHPGLVHPTSQTLNLDWLELAGRGAPTYGLLRQQGLLPQEPNKRGQRRRFVGVDHDEDTITELRATYLNPDALWVHDSIESLLNEKDDPRTRGVGVVNYDSHSGTGEPLRKALDILFAFADHQYQRHGAFMLILNIPRVFRQRKDDMVKWLVVQLSHYRDPKYYKYSEEQLLQHFYHSSKGSDMCNIRLPYGA